MIQHIDTLRKTRAFLADIIKDLSVEQLNTVPDGYSNNIIWNYAHLIAAQQGVCYKRAGLPVIVDEGFFDDYKPGTRPERIVSEEEVAEIKELAQSTIDRFEEDYHKNTFSSYTPWSTRYGVHLATIEDAIQFVQYHEGLHAGYIMALRRAVMHQPAMQ